MQTVGVLNGFHTVSILKWQSSDDFCMSWPSQLEEKGTAMVASEQQSTVQDQLFQTSGHKRVNFQWDIGTLRSSFSSNKTAIYLLFPP